MMQQEPERNSMREKELVDHLQALRRVLAELVDLKDGPRDSAYYERKPAAWEEARALLAVPVPSRCHCGEYPMGPYYCLTLFGSDDAVVERHAVGACETNGGKLVWTEMS